MIQELRFKNFLSFRDEAIFSFEPTKDEPINRVATMADGTKLLRFAVVFGANASGKSNFLEVLDFLRRFWTQVPRRNDLSTRVIPFLLDKNTPSEDSVFEMKFYVDPMFTQKYGTIALFTNSVIPAKLIDDEVVCFKFDLYKNTLKDKTISLKDL